MRILGVDPGATGGMFAVNSDRTCPVLHKSSSVEADLALSIAEALEGVSLVVVEQVSSRPGQGVSSTFTFGTRYGIIIGAVLSRKLPLFKVTPKKWQKEFGVLVSEGAIPVGMDKKKVSQARRKILKARSYEVARALYPTVNSNVHVADGILIAEYGIRTYSHARQ